jgi:hypothetical protein
MMHSILRFHICYLFFAFATPIGVSLMLHMLMCYGLLVYLLSAINNLIKIPLSIHWYSDYPEKRIAAPEL